MIGNNPVSRLVPDDEGYYTVVLAEPSKVAPSGRVYDPAAVAEAYQNRLAKGPLFVEYGTPRLDGLNYEEAIYRTSTIEEDRICGVIATGSVDGTIILGRFKPIGPFGGVVKDMLANPDESLHFGMRSLVARDGSPNATLHTFVTFDLGSPPTPPRKESPAICTHPENCTFCGWCGFKATPDPIVLFESVLGKNPTAFLHEPVYQVTESEVREYARLLCLQNNQKPDGVTQ